MHKQPSHPQSLSRLISKMNHHNQPLTHITASHPQSIITSTHNHHIPIHYHTSYISYQSVALIMQQLMLTLTQSIEISPRNTRTLHNSRNPYNNCHFKTTYSMFKTNSNTNIPTQTPHLHPQTPQVCFTLNASSTTLH